VACRTCATRSRAEHRICRFRDIYTKRLEDARKVAPNAKTYLDTAICSMTRALTAVLIATRSICTASTSPRAGRRKQVYQEKTMAFTVDHAKRMRAAYKKAGKRTVQMGTKACSSVR